MRLLALTNIFPSPERPWLGTFIEQQLAGLRSIGVDIKVLFFDRMNEGPLVYHRMVPRISEAVGSFQPDLVHAMYGGVMADRITRHSWSRPVVVTFHGSDLLGENLSGVLRKVVAFYGVLCSRRAARRAAGVVVVARHLEARLPKDVERRKVRVIPCGVDLERFKPMNPEVCRQKLGWDSSRLQVLFPANTGDPVKRPWLAQSAVRALEDIGVKADLRVLSGVPYAEVPLWINASHVLILTSLHEGSPTVVKESLACGVPVVSVDVGDVAERIAGIVGCHLAEAQPKDLALKLAEVLSLIHI